MGNKMHISNEKQKELEDYMSDGGWYLSGEIKAATGLNARVIRYIANETTTLIGGQYGYKLTSKSSVAEIEENIATLKSRAKKISERARNLEILIRHKHAKSTL